jgi:hypothetical protein
MIEFLEKLILMILKVNMLLGQLMEYMQALAVIEMVNLIVQMCVELLSQNLKILI